MRVEATSSTSDECGVCHSNQASTHFGVIACRSCASFFRRSNILKKKYICRNGEHCYIEQDARASCPACRFRRCLEVGMEAEKIRLNFDKNGPRSRPAPATSLEPQENKLLTKMSQGYRRFRDNLKTLYFSIHPENALSEEIVFRRVTVREHCIFDRLTVPYYLRMLNNYFCPFKDLKMDEKKRILEAFHLLFYILNLEYSNIVYFKPEDKKQYLHLGAYIDQIGVEYFFSQQKNPSEIGRIFAKIIMKFRKVASKFRAVGTDETEISALIGIALWNEADDVLPNRGHSEMLARIQTELSEYCRQKHSDDISRVGLVISLLRGVEELKILFSEGLTMCQILREIPDQTTDLFKL